MSLRLENEIVFEYEDITYYSTESDENGRSVLRNELKNGLKYSVREIMRGSLLFAKECADDLRDDLDADEPITPEYILSLTGYKRVMTEKMWNKFNNALKPFMDCAKNLNIENKECLYIVLAYCWSEKNNVIIDWLVEDIFNKNYEGRSKYKKSEFITKAWKGFQDQTFYSEGFRIGGNTFMNLFIKEAKESGLFFSDILRPIEDFKTEDLCDLYCLFQINNKEDILSLSAEGEKIQDKKQVLRCSALPEFFDLIHKNKLRNEVSINYIGGASKEILEVYESMTGEGKADYVAKNIEKWIKNKKNVNYIDTVNAVLTIISDTYPEVVEKIEKNAFTNSLFDDLNEKDGISEFFINPNILYKMIMFEKNTLNKKADESQEEKKNSLMTINNLRFRSIYMEKEITAIHDSLDEYKTMREMMYATVEDEEELDSLYTGDVLQESERLVSNAKLVMLEKFVGEIRSIVNGTEVTFKHQKKTMNIEGENVTGLLVQCDSKLLKMIKEWFVDISMAGPTFVEEEVEKGCIKLDDYLMREKLLVNNKNEVMESSSRKRIKF